MIRLGRGFSAYPAAIAPHLPTRRDHRSSSVIPSGSRQLASLAPCHIRIDLIRVIESPLAIFSGYLFGVVNTILVTVGSKFFGVFNTVLVIVGRHTVEVAEPPLSPAISPLLGVFDVPSATILAPLFQVVLIILMMASSGLFNMIHTILTAVLALTLLAPILQTIRVLGTPVKFRDGLNNATMWTTLLIHKIHHFFTYEIRFSQAVGEPLFGDQPRLNHKHKERRKLHMTIEIGRELAERRAP